MKENIKNKSSIIYKVLLLTIYILTLMVLHHCFHLLKNTTNNFDINFILTAGALFATFGAAILGFCLVFNSDLEKRLELSLDILNRDILKEENPWRRWPFLKRESKIKVLNGNTLDFNLTNKIVCLDFGFYQRDFEIPSIFEDYFDLPFIENLYLLQKRKKTFLTDFSRCRDSYNFEYMKYFCLLDIYWCLLKLRLIRLGIHFSTGMIIYSFVILIMKLFSIDWYFYLI